jgi:hypothetical protein
VRGGRELFFFCIFCFCAGYFLDEYLTYAIFFWDDFPKWIEYAKKLWNDPSIPFQGNIRTKSKSQVTQKDILEIQRQQRERLEEQMKEAKKGFKEILDSHKPYVKYYGQDLRENLDKYQQQLDARNLKVKNRSIKGTTITNGERDFLWEGISKRKRVPCINCREEDMYKGRTEGSSQNWYCPACGQGIKLSFTENTKSGFKCENLGVDRNKRNFM